MKVSGLISFIISIILTSAVQGQNAINLTLAGQWGYGTCRFVETNDDYCFMSSGYTLIIFDVSNPYLPVKISELLMPDQITGIAITGNHVYIAADESGLQIVNIENIAAPFIEGAFENSGYTYDVAVSGNYAFIADLYSGLKIIDVSNPALPFQVSVFTSNGTSTRILLDGIYAYLSSGTGGIHILNISIPSTPVQEGIFSSNANDIALSGSYLYLACSQSIKVVDVSNPASPAFVCYFPTYYNPFGIAVENKVAFISHGHNMDIIDFGDFSAPVELGSYSPGEGGAYSISLQNNYAYVAYSGAGLRIIDISDYASPFETANYPFPGWMTDVVVIGSYAYITDHSFGLRIVDITNPESLVEIGSWYCSDYVKSITIIGEYAYIAASPSFYIINVSDPQNPLEIGYYNVPYGVSGLFISGDYAYVSSWDMGLRIVDISDPSSPFEVGYFNPPLYTSFGPACVLANYVYVSSSEGIYILDVSNPSSPILVTTYPGIKATDFAVNGNYAFVTDYENGLAILDISDPSAPFEAGFYNLDGYITGITLSGCHALVSTNYSGIHILNISDPYYPYEEANYEMPYHGDGLEISSEYAYVTDIEAGLLILHMEIPVQLELTPPSYIFGYEAGSIQVFVNTDTDWSIEENCDWLSCDPVSGSECGTINVSCTENTSHFPRFCTIMVYGDTLTAECTITQYGLPAVLNIDPLSQTVGTEAGYSIVLVNSNVDWTVNENCSWVTCVPDSGSNDGAFAAVYEQNTGTEPRTCFLTINGLWLIQYFTLVQDGLVSINESGNHEVCSVHPNPFTDHLIFNIDLPGANSFTITIFNQTGTKIKTININNIDQGNQQYELQTGDIHPGLYFFHIELFSPTGQHSFNGKLLKNK